MIHSPVVIKFGGSLLRGSHLGELLLYWLSKRPHDTRCVLIAGGGEEVDSLRRQHAAGKLTDEQAHWAAIEVMDANAKRLANEMRVPLSDDYATLVRGFGRLGRGYMHYWPPLSDQSEGRVCCFAPGRFLKTKEPGLMGIRLPVGWEVTSDSIAARIADLMDASLVLLKATPPPPALAEDIQALADIGYVDPFFPRASFGLRELEFQTL